LIAPFFDTVPVVIHMFRGEHFLIENRADALNLYQNVEAFDDLALNLNLTIRPLYCNHVTSNRTQIDPSICSNKTEKVTIYNKIRDRLNFRVLRAFRLENIKIDAADSILPFGTPCLSEYRRCCMVDDTNGFKMPGVKNYNSSRDEQCAKHFSELSLTDQCQLGEPRTLFKFIVTNDWKQYEEFTTNQLEIVNSEISNFFYGMNSMVNITFHGG